MDASADAMGGNHPSQDAAPKARDYTLCRRHQRQAAKARVVPPKPRKGERQPVPYSKADRDALRATCHAFKPLAMVTLKASPSAPLVTWPELRGKLLKLKSVLTNLKGRRGFPASLCVTEFDPMEMDGQEVPGGAFHIGFAQPLTADQQKRLLDWWLAQIGQANNQGRYFQHDADGGGQRLTDYLAKDVTFRDRQARPVKFRPEWMPKRIDCRLWFCVGMKHSRASEGRKLRASTGRVLRTFESAHGKSQPLKLKARTGKRESEHATPLVTTDQSAGQPLHSDAVATAAAEAVHPAGGTLKTTSEALAGTVADQVVSSGAKRPLCPVCWTRWGRSLWAGSCKCNPAFPEC